MKRPTDRDGLVTAVEAVIENLGLDPSELGLVRTPERVADFLLEFMNDVNYAELLGDGFEVPGKHASMVTQSKIPFRMICEHHLLPALGHASIGYIPNERVIGLSKLARLVQAVGTERPGLQEGICDKICEVMNEHLKPMGVIAVISAEHTCMACRGVATPGVMTTTSSIRGVFLTNPAARDEFFRIVSMGNV